MRAARDQRRETLPGLFQQLRLDVPGEDEEGEKKGDEGSGGSQSVSGTGTGSSLHNGGSTNSALLQAILYERATTITLRYH